MKNAFFTLLITLLLASCSSTSHRLELSGEWTVRLDSTDIGITESWQGKMYETAIQLPGTTDDAGLGVPTAVEPTLESSVLQHLTRANQHIGPAWYARSIAIPSNWEGKEYFLNLERVLWSTQVWVDGTQVAGEEESLIAPHQYNLTPYLTAGKNHILTIRVDNRQRHDISVKELAHAYTNHTQIKWNGILGEMHIEAVEKVRITGIQLYPDVDKNQVKAIVSLTNNTPYKVQSSLSFAVATKDGSKKLATKVKEATVAIGNSTIELLYDMGTEALLWSEFAPNLYEACANLNVNGVLSTRTESFGFRQLKRDGNRMMLNGTPLFLRGTLECCIFPLTGTPPMTKEAWKKVYTSAQDYGLNHLRFHSWCPPKAAFEAADEMGFYLQVELPLWALTVGNDEGTTNFLKEEATRIIANYGNHPSFCFWSLGNELEGNFELMASMVDDLKARDNRHLYCNTSFTFQKGHGAWPEANDDFFITQWTNKGWVRGQGVFNQYSPTFDKDYKASVEGMEVPLITHEIGQYSVYPDMTEIEKYTGVLKPLNFIAVKNDLEKKGLLDKAPDYLMASGKLAAILYKEEIERALKTAGISGFQLLDLHDFPGQGTALVGLLNAFWESKGIITGKEFREFCSPVVPLLRFPKAVYSNNETFKAELELCNYGNKELTNQTLAWSISNGATVLEEGTVQVDALTFGYNNKLGTLSIPLTKVEKAAKLEVVLRVVGTDYVNRWNIWAYPTTSTPTLGEVKYTRSYTKAKELLAKGETVLFNPNWKTMKGIEGKFVPVFWSPVHFPNQAGTMGLLCDPSHPALAHFPTDMHTDWQWWDLNINSTAMITDTIQGGSPIVEMVDNFANNRRLASLYEGKVGNGKLMLATFDLGTELEKRPVAKQMLFSLLNYMNSEAFNPATLSNFDWMEGLFETTTNQKQSAEAIY